MIVANAGTCKCIMSHSRGQVQVLPDEKEHSSISETKPQGKAASSGASESRPNDANSGLTTAPSRLRKPQTLVNPNPYNLRSKSKGRNTKPEQRKIAADDIDFILLGSEGLWKSLSVENAISIMHKYKEQIGDIHDASGALIAGYLEQAGNASAQLECDILFIIIDLKKAISTTCTTIGTVPTKELCLVPRYISQSVQLALRQNNLQKIFIICRTMDTEAILSKLAEVTSSDDPASPSYWLTADRGTEYCPELKQVCLRAGPEYEVKSKDKAFQLHAVIEAFKALAPNSGFMNIRTLKYLHPKLFVETDSASKIVKVASILTRATRASLGILATSTGFVAGPVKLIIKRFGRTYSHDCEHLMGWLSVPIEVADIVDVVRKPNSTRIRCILVVEKHTVFVNLSNAGILEKVGCVMVTGCGQPDEATRILIPKMAAALDVPVYGLFDCSEHGLEIFSTYKFGSMSHAHDNVGLTVPGMRLLGLHPFFVEANVPEKYHEPFEDYDSRYLANFLAREHVRDDAELAGFANAMLCKGIKCQLDILVCTGKPTNPEAILEYVQSRIADVEAGSDVANLQSYVAE